MINHPIAPLFNHKSEILILGSFPSVKSREQGFFYGHPQNRFWRVLAAIFDQPVPATVDEKKGFLLKNKIALWDVIASCTIVGSADSSIRDVSPVNLDVILSECPIRRIFVNGGTAKRLYDRWLYPVCGIEATQLPSTSPANAAWNLERLIDAWMTIKN